MEISTAIKKLYEVYIKGDHSLGCVSRASILFYIMKNEGYNPKRRTFYFKDKNGKKVERSTHCVVILNNNIYDTNVEPFHNPIDFNEYCEEMIKKGDLVWENWEESSIGINYDIRDVKNYLLTNFDKEFQEEVKPLIEPEYQAFFDENPDLKTD